MMSSANLMYLGIHGTGSFFLSRTIEGKEYIEMGGVRVPS